MMTEDYPLVFAVNSAFIGESGGSYDDAVIIAMGCESHYLDDLPAAFIEKGAAAYVGWSGVVGLEYVDEATLALLDRLCVQDMTLADAVTATMEEPGYDPYFGSHLKLTLPSGAARTIGELIRQPD